MARNELIFTSLGVDQAMQISVHRQPFSEVLFGSHLLGVVSSIMLMPVINGGEKASYGGVLRDANGHWINGFTRQLGRCSIMAFLECEDYLHVLCEANSVADNLASEFKLSFILGFKPISISTCFLFIYSLTKLSSRESRTLDSTA